MDFGYKNKIVFIISQKGGERLEDNDPMESYMDSIKKKLISEADSKFNRFRSSPFFLLLEFNWSICFYEIEKNNKKKVETGDNEEGDDEDDANQYEFLDSDGQRAIQLPKFQFC